MDVFLLIAGLGLAVVLGVIASLIGRHHRNRASVDIWGPPVGGSTSGIEKDDRGGHSVTFTARAGLMSAGEERFYRSLRNEVAGEFIIAMKVRIADVISHKCRDRKTWFREFGRMSQKHFDFVLISTSTLRICAAIELDDSSHTSKKARRRDQYVNELCNQAGLPLIRFRVRNHYDFSALSSIRGMGKHEDHNRVLRPSREDNRKRPSDGDSDGDRT